MDSLCPYRPIFRSSPWHARPDLDMSLPVFTHSACLEHDTGAGHFERPQRLGAVIDALRTGVADDIDWREAPRATRGQLLRVHDASLLEAVLETDRKSTRLNSSH